MSTPRKDAQTELDRRLEVVHQKVKRRFAKTQRARDRERAAAQRTAEKSEDLKDIDEKKRKAERRLKALEQRKADHLSEIRKLTKGREADEAKLQRMKQEIAAAPDSDQAAALAESKLSQQIEELQRELKEWQEGCETRLEAVAAKLCEAATAAAAGGEEAQDGQPSLRQAADCFTELARRAQKKGDGEKPASLLESIFRVLCDDAAAVALMDEVCPPKPRPSDAPELNEDGDGCVAEPAPEGQAPGEEARGTKRAADADVGGDEKRQRSAEQPAEPQNSQLPPQPEPPQPPPQTEPPQQQAEEGTGTGGEQPAAEPTPSAGPADDESP